MLALATWLALAPQPSAVEEAPSPKSHQGRKYHLDIEAQTNLPLDVGARISAEFPHRLQLSTSLGGLPGGYVDIVNAAVVSAGGYDESDAEIVRDALQRALVWRTHVGWRITKRRGLYVQAGYGLVTLGGNAAGGDVLSLITGDDLLAGQGNDLVELHSTLHMVDAEIGWQFLALQGNLSIRTALGFAGTVGARTRASVQGGTRPPRVQAALEDAADFVEGYLDDIYTKYVFTPVITVGVGYRIF